MKNKNIRLTEEELKGILKEVIEKHPPHPPCDLSTANLDSSNWFSHWTEDDDDECGMLSHWNE